MMQIVAFSMGKLFDAFKTFNCRYEYGFRDVVFLLLVILKIVRLEIAKHKRTNKKYLIKNNLFIINFMVKLFYYEAYL